ncbi:MAG: hypothetical protein P4L99_19140 [Chthoniobacter sp.]|nr:hypothetical protein [Chthoniobacter sp.]
MAIFGLYLSSNARATVLTAGNVAGSAVNGQATLQLQAIPEPQTWVIAFAGLGTLISLQRFRRSRGSVKRQPSTPL